MFRAEGRAQRAAVAGFVVLVIGALTCLPLWAAEPEAQPGTLVLTLIDPEGNPIPGARVESAGLDPAITDATGSARLAGLRAGRRVVDVVAAGFAASEIVVEVEAGALVERRLVVARIELAFEEVVVSSGFSIAQPGAGGAGASLDREQISRLPAFGEDLYRAVSTLPGTSRGDLSARFSVRGSLDTEVLARLDGIELHEPFHLRDYEGVFSIVDPGLIGRADLITGGMPVEFGERSAGALDMRSRSPQSSASELGISFTNLWFRNEGVFADGRARWLASGRRGFLDLVLEISGEGEEESGEGEEGDGGAPSPAYWDAFAKLEYDLSPRSRWAFHVLGSGDTLEEKENEDGEIEDYDTSYDSAYLWATHTWIPRDALAVATHLEGTRLARDRRIFSAEFDDEARARDQRDTTILGARQDWTWDRGGDRLVKFGFGAKRFTSDYDYENEISLQSLIADVRFQPPIGEFAFDGEISGTSWHAYVADRRRLGRLTTELGVRYDRDVLSESHVAPRLNLVYDGARWGEWRAGAGRFVQPQRPHELDVADGVTTLSASETSDGYYAGWSRDVSGYAVRVEGYYRRTNDPRPRFESLFQSWNPFPEAATDRIRLAPKSSTSRGVEWLVVSPRSRAFEWWASYTLARVTDEIDGRDQPRSIDQRHAVTVNLNYRPNPRWNFNALWTWHSGWPTTSVTATTEIGPGGEVVIVPSVGEFYSESLPSYHRLDLRVARRVPIRKGELSFYIDLQNAYDRQNLRGFEYTDDSFQVQSDGSVTVDPETENWLGLLPSFGVAWRF